MLVHVRERGGEGASIKRITVVILAIQSPPRPHSCVASLSAIMTLYGDPLPESLLVRSCYESRSSSIICIQLRFWARQNDCIAKPANRIQASDQRSKSHWRILPPGLFWSSHTLGFSCALCLPGLGTRASQSSNIQPRRPSLSCLLPGLTAFGH